MTIATQLIHLAERTQMVQPPVGPTAANGRRIPEQARVVHWMASCGGFHAGGLRSQSLNAILLCIGVGLGADGALAAPTPELAKKCAALTRKAFPPRVVGNPAAGSFGGSGRSEQAYFNKCIKNEGIVEEEPNKGPGAQDDPASAMPKR
jgi:hypothetical protein